MRVGKDFLRSFIADVIVKAGKGIPVLPFVIAGLEAMLLCRKGGVY